MARPLGEPAAGSEAGRRSSADVIPSSTEQPATNLLWAFLGGDGRVEVLVRYAPPVARLLIAQIFIISGIMKIMDPAGTAAQMEGRGMFWVPFFLWSAAAVELGCGLSLLLGYKTRLGALVLFLFLIPVTLTFHNFWTYADPKERHVNMLFFMHNLALMGGLLLVITFGAGPFSLDHRRRRAS